MTRLALQLSLPAVAAWKRSGGGAALSGAATLLGAETNGLAFAASDDSMEIRDTVTPANNYVGSTITKFGNVRASAAMQYGSTGLLEWGSENLLTQSENLAAWSAANGTVSTNVTAAPNGTMTADMFTSFVSSGANIFQTVTIASGVFTKSVYVKKGTAAFLYIDLYDGASHVAWFNLTTGSVGTVNAGVTASIVADVGGWYRCIVTNTHAGGTIYFVCGTSDADGSTACAAPVTIYLWGGQVNHGATAHTYLPTTSSVVYALRRDYDPSVTGPKYLLEEQRTNYCLYSNDFSNAAWTKDATTVAQNVTGLDGTTSAWTMTDSASNVEHRIFQLVGVLGATTAQFIHAKAGTANFVGISTAGGAEYAVFNLATGAVASSAGTVASIVPAGSGFYKCMTIPTTPGAYLIINMGRTAAEATTGGTYAGTGSTIIITSVQSEVGPSASSYIPTTSATVTRAYDSGGIARSSFNYNDAACTFYAKVRPRYATGGGDVVFGVTKNHDSGDANFFDYIGPDYRNLILSSAGGLEANNTVSGSALAINKLAAAMAANDSAAVANGGTPVTDATVIMPVGINQVSLSGSPTQARFNGWVLDGMQLPRRMSNAELQTLTTP